jgi:hypothetical protein
LFEGRWINVEPVLLGGVEEYALLVDTSLG